MKRKSDTKSEPKQDLKRAKLVRTQITDLPPELLLSIAEYLPITDLLSWEQTDHFFYESLSEDSYLWKSLLKRYFPACQGQHGPKKERQLFIENCKRLADISPEFLAFYLRLFEHKLDELKLLYPSLLSLKSLGVFKGQNLVFILRGLKSNGCYEPELEYLYSLACQYDLLKESKNEFSNIKMPLVRDLLFKGVVDDNPIDEALSFLYESEFNDELIHLIENHVISINDLETIKGKYICYAYWASFLSKVVHSENRLAMIEKIKPLLSDKDIVYFIGHLIEDFDFLKKSFKPEVIDNLLPQIIQQALIQNNVLFLNFILKKGYEITDQAVKVNENNQILWGNLLISSVKQNLQALLMEFCTISMKDKSLKEAQPIFQNAFREAINTGNFEIINYFLEIGFQTEFMDANGKTPLIWAIESRIKTEDKKTVIRILVDASENKENILSRWSIDGQGKYHSIMNSALLTQDMILINFLLDEGACLSDQGILNSSESLKNKIITLQEARQIVASESVPVLTDKIVNLTCDIIYSYQQSKDQQADVFKDLFNAMLNRYPEIIMEKIVWYAAAKNTSFPLIKKLVEQGLSSYDSSDLQPCLSTAMTRALEQEQEMQLQVVEQVFPHCDKDALAQLTFFSKVRLYSYRRYLSQELIKSFCLPLDDLINTLRDMSYYNLAQIQDKKVRWFLSLWKLQMNIDNDSQIEFNFLRFLLTTIPERLLEEDQQCFNQTILRIKPQQLPEKAYLLLLPVIKSGQVIALEKLLESDSQNSLLTASSYRAEAFKLAARLGRKDLMDSFVEKAEMVVELTHSYLFSNYCNTHSDLIQPGLIPLKRPEVLKKLIQERLTEDEHVNATELLMIAAEAGHFDIVKLLVEQFPQRALIHHHEKAGFWAGFSALTLSLKNQHIDIFTYLMEKGNQEYRVDDLKKIIELSKQNPDSFYIQRVLNLYLDRMPIFSKSTELTTKDVWDLLSLYSQSAQVDEIIKNIIKNTIKTNSNINWTAIAMLSIKGKIYNKIRCFFEHVAKRTNTPVDYNYRIEQGAEKGFSSLTFAIQNKDEALVKRLLYINKAKFDAKDREILNQCSDEKFKEAVNNLLNPPLYISSSEIVFFPVSNQTNTREISPSVFKRP